MSKVLVKHNGVWKDAGYIPKPPYITMTLNFDPVLFKTDPTECLTYAGDAKGWKKLSNTASSLQKVTDEGSWGFNDNPFFQKCCYATFDASGK